MIERQLFVRLKPEHATELGRAELRARCATLVALPGVEGLTVGAPADEGARSAWDLSLTLRFASLEEVERCLVHAIYQAFQQGFLEPRAQVIKAWNFEV